MEEVRLTPEEAALMVEIEIQAQAVNNQAIGAIRMMLKTRGLEGNWTLTPDKTRLIRTSPVAGVPAASGKPNGAAHAEV